jgi:hypothetical protein
MVGLYGRRTMIRRQTIEVYCSGNRLLSILSPSSVVTLLEERLVEDFDVLVVARDLVGRPPARIHFVEWR